jgi:hypothetical protein
MGYVGYLVIHFIFTDQQKIIVIFFSRKNCKSPRPTGSINKERTKIGVTAMGATTEYTQSGDCRFLAYIPL